MPAWPACQILAKFHHEVFGVEASGLPRFKKNRRGFERWHAGQPYSQSPTFEYFELRKFSSPTFVEFRKPVHNQIC